MKYRDYFSLKTLNRFGVSPDRTLVTEGRPEEVKQNILAAFGAPDEVLSAEDFAFLAHKTDCALLDMHVIEPIREREAIEVPEANERFEAPVAGIPEVRAPSVERTL